MLLLLLLLLPLLPLPLPLLQWDLPVVGRRVGVRIQKDCGHTKKPDLMRPVALI